MCLMAAPKYPGQGLAHSKRLSVNTLLNQTDQTVKPVADTDDPIFTSPLPFVSSAKVAS